MRFLALAAALALTGTVAGCGWIGGELSTRDLCRLAKDADVRAALGVDEAGELAFAMENGACVWRAPSSDGRAREMSAFVEHETDMHRALPPRTPAAAFEQALKDLERDYPRTRVLGGLGEVAVIGFGEIGEDRFAGGLVSRKKGDLLVMRIEGDDPAAFEAAARAMAEKL